MQFADVAFQKRRSYEDSNDEIDTEICNIKIIR